MRLCLTVFGMKVFELTSDSESHDQPPALEASGGGQFELGFNSTNPGHVTCQCKSSRPR